MAMATASYKGKTMKSMELKSIPQELILEIFSWLPFKSLMRYRCVSKFYNSLLFESNFADIHHQRSMTRPGGRKYLVYKEDTFYTTELKKDGETSLLHIENFDQFGKYCRVHSRLMCVNALICTWTEKHIAICCSNTREVRFLPCQKEFVNNYSHQVCSVGYEPEEKNYKLWLTHFFVDGYTRNWVFTLNIDKSWRPCKCNVSFNPSPTRVCIRGVIYMLSYGYYHNNPLGIVAFDVRAETFRIFKFPPALHRNGCVDYNFIEVKGKFAVLNYKKYSSEDVHLWILGKAQNDDWERHIIRFPSEWEGIDVGPESHFGFLCTSCDEEIIFEYITKSIVCIHICYNYTRKSWREFGAIKEVGERHSFDNIFCYVENLFSLGKLCSSNLQD